MGAPSFLAGETLAASQLKLQTVHSCTSGTRPGSPFEGLQIHETDTDKGYVYTGAAWSQVYALGAWDTYTPTDTNITVGNGTRNAAWTRVGRLVFFRYELTWGSTTAFGGNPQVGLPVAAIASRRFICPAILSDVGTRNFIGMAEVNVSSASSAELKHTESGNAGDVNATNPFTWTTSDRFVVTGTYEAAAAS